MQSYPASIHPGHPTQRLLAAAIAVGLLAAILLVPSSPGRAAASQASQPDDPAGLSLVYLDTMRADVTTMHLAEFDGANPVRIFNLTPRARTLDIRGRYTAGSIGATLTISDLRPGADDYWSVTGRDEVRSAALAEDGTAFYSTGFGCRSMPDALPQPSRLYRLEPRSMVARELAGSVSRVLEVIGLDSEAGEVFVLPRGCDIGIDEIQVYSTETGELLRTHAVQGCGRASVSRNGRRALTTWQGCTVPEAHAGAIATVYDLTTGEGRDLTGFPSEDLRGDVLLSPDGAAIALGGSYGGLAGSRGSADAAVWLLDAATLVIHPPATTPGREAFPVAFSPDGRHLLVGTAEAQGRCRYDIIEVIGAIPGAKRPVNPEITVCGANGRVLGWTETGGQ